jgi:uncharacterized membrane protein
MKITKLLGLTICILLIAGIFIGCFAQPVKALIDDDNNPLITDIHQQTTGEVVTLSCKYPDLSGTATTEFGYDVMLLYYSGTESKLFDLKVTGPDVFSYSIRQSYGGDTDVASIKLDPGKTLGETLKIKASPNIFNLPQPGEYTFTFTATSGDLTRTIDLKAIVTAKYGLIIDTTGGILSTQLTADKDNYFTVTVVNTGTADLKDINLTTSVRGSPSNWEVKTEPTEIGTLAPKEEKEVKLNIRPPAKTISGDYEVSLTAKTKAANAQDEIKIRVTVLTQNIWGWVGIGIVVIVVAGLIVMFMFLGRR